MAEHSDDNRRVKGSNPFPRTNLLERRYYAGWINRNQMQIL